MKTAYEKTMAMLKSINDEINTAEYWWDMWNKSEDEKHYHNCIKHHYALNAKVEMFNIAFDTNYTMYTIPDMINEYGIK